MARKQTAATPCECSFFDAVPANLTEQQLADGSYEMADTGCTATTRNTFAPGHDAKLKSFLIQMGAQGWEVRRQIVIAPVLDHAKGYGFLTQVTAGIAKAQAKAEAKAKRAANKPVKAERKLAESAGVVPSGALTDEQVGAYREGAAKHLAEIVKTEEEAYAAQEAARVLAPEWDDEKPSETPSEPVAPILEDEAAMNAHAREVREADMITAKVGRWEYLGRVSEDGATFSYVAKDGTRKETAKFSLI